MAGIARIGVDPQRKGSRQGLADGPDRSGHQTQRTGELTRTGDDPRQRVDRNIERGKYGDEVDDPSSPDIVPDMLLRVAPRRRLRLSLQRRLRLNAAIGENVILPRDADGCVAMGALLGAYDRGLVNGCLLYTSDAADE